MNTVGLIMVLIIMIVAISSKSYVVYGVSVIAVLAMNEAYSAGGLTQFLSVVLLFIVARFIHRHRKYARNQRHIYREGREHAKHDKKYNSGYNDEYYN